ncbi:MAG: ABC transporter substrate-binding protein [Alphaproteobacteria bacterium]|nr:ABC transporter substrate-binding protein [Alphaproteobacteria bacterium]
MGLRRILGFIGIAALLALPAGRGQAQQLAQAAPFSYSVLEATPAFHSLPMLALKEFGGEFNLKLDYMQLQGGGETGAVFAGGHGDVLMAGIDKAFGFKHAGLVDAKVIGVILTSANWSMVATTKSQMKSPADLKGKAIGISGPGSSSDMLVRWSVRRVGLDPDRDVQLVALGSVANLYAGLENDRVPAGVLVQPFLNRAVTGNVVRVIDDWEAMSYPNSVIMVRTKDLQANRAKFVHLMSALKSALGRMKDDRAFAMRVAKKTYPAIPDAELNAQLDHAIRTLWKPMDGVMTKELYENARSVFVGSGRLKAADIPPMEELVENLL